MFRMERIAIIVLCLLLPLPLSALAPVSAEIGEVAVSVDDGSITDTALKAAREEYTESWLERYAASPLVFGEAYSSLLSDILPLGNPIAGIERNGAVDIQDLESGTVLSFIFQEGRLVAVYPSKAPEFPES